MNEADLRISDAERADAAAALGEHYAQGRIDLDEHAERLDRIWAARTRRELAPVFADLPGYAPPTTYAGPGRSRPARRSHRTGGVPFVLVAVRVVLAVVTVATHLPLVLIGLGVWFLVARSRSRHFCAPRVRGPRPPAGWSSPPRW
jgi:hypothetical protein